MPKRKIEDIHGDEDEDGEECNRKSRLTAKISQGNTLLHRALKVARGFERQKLGRRQKAANEKPHELLRLREEVIVLKQLDLAKTAENYLLKQLVRTKRIREQPALVSLYGKDAERKVKGPNCGAEANVVARLVNSNPVKEVMPGIMSGIYRCLGLEEHPTTMAARGEIQSQSATKFSGEGSTKPKGKTQSGEFNHQASDKPGEQSGDRSMTDHRRPIEQVSDTEALDSDEDMAQFEDRLASSSDSEDSNIEDNETSRTQFLHRDVSSRRIRSASPRSSVSLTLSPSPTPQPSKAPTKPPTTNPPNNTTFLPSLTLGGYFSGSDSDTGSDIDGNYNRRPPLGPALPKPRKNRRGQRARQQIAENKYGSKAKHLLKQQQQQQQGKVKANEVGRDEGWDVKWGATDDQQRAGGNPRKGGERRGRGYEKGRLRKAVIGAGGVDGEAVSAGGTKREISKKSKDGGDGPIHPSWEAARKRKAQGQTAAGGFQGKKISFD